MSDLKEAHPRIQVDAALVSAGWTLQDGNEANPDAGYAIAIRRFPLAFSPRHGNADYMLYIAGSAIGAVRILQELTPLKDPEKQQAVLAGTAVEEPAGDDLALPSAEPMHWERQAKPVIERRKAPRTSFLYETDGVKIHFRDSRTEPAFAYLLYHFHRPETLAAKTGETARPHPNGTTELLTADTETFRQRLDAIPRIADRALWPGERQVLEALEGTLRRGYRRVLAQMAPGSGKTHTLLNMAYQLLEHAKVQRVLLIVDNDPLAYQTAEEFRVLRPPAAGSPSATPLPFDTGPQSHSIPVQQLSGNRINSSARLIISSPYRLLSFWEQVGSAGAETVSGTLYSPKCAAALPVLPLKNAADNGDRVAAYNTHLPVEAFDMILCDDISAAACPILKPLLNYFDAPVAGITGTPSRQVLELFEGRLVAEYPYEQAIADGAILPFATYAIRVKQESDDQYETQAGPLEIQQHADPIPRVQRWQGIDDAVELPEYRLPGNAKEREQQDLAEFTTLLTLRDRLPREIFSHRTQVPKTLIVARDHAHALSVLELCREVFPTEENFAAVLTTPSSETDKGEYRDVVFHPPVDGNPRPFGEPRTPSPDARYPQLHAFRSESYPRIGIIEADSFAVTLDLRPAELLVMMAGVFSRAHFETIKARALRNVRRVEYLKLTPDGHPVAGKTHAVVVDTVGMFDAEAPSETFPLDRRPTVPLAQLLHEVAFATVSHHTVRALAARFLHLDCLLSPAERDAVAKAAGGATLHTLAMRMITSLDIDRQVAHASRALRPGMQPNGKSVEQAAAALLQQAVARLHSSVELRSRIIQLDRQHNPKPRDEEEAALESEENAVEDLGNEETWR